METQHRSRLVAVLLAAALPGMAANHYVRKGASGNGTGTDWTNACTDFTGSCAAASLVRGDTYYVAAGAYASPTFKAPDSGSTMITVVRATTGSHGTSTGWSDSYDGQATFGGHIIFNSDYWVLDGVTGGGPSNWMGPMGFSISPTDANPGIDIGSTKYVTIRHIEVYGNQNDSGGGGTAQDGVASGGATNFTLSYWYIHNMGRCIFFFVPINTALIEYGYSGLYVSTSAAHAEIASIWGGSNGIQFAYNMFAYSAGTGGLIFDNHENPNGAGMQVYGNVFYDANGTWQGGNGAIGGWTGANGEQYHNVSIYNNTFYNLAIAPLGNLSQIYSGNTVYNNIFYNTATVQFNVYGTHDYNYSINSGSLGEAHGQSSPTTNPFVSVSGLNFGLLADTNAGIALASPYNLDPFGVTRGASGVWDRGAYQVSGTSGGGTGGGGSVNPPTGLGTTRIQ